MEILKLINTINQDCNFVDSINESEYIEKINNNNNKIKNNKIKSLVYCIFSQYDPIFQTIPNNEKKLYFKNKITEICSLIDENKDKYYNNFKLNEKILKTKIIQYSLQSSLENENLLSSLLYLNELYKKHFIIIYNNNYYETSLKNYSKDYILFKDDVFSFTEFNDNLKIDKIQNLPIKNDLNKFNLIDYYHKNLKPISNYKLNDLHNIASELNISIKNNIKNKTKQDLYNEINIYHLNL